MPNLSTAIRRKLLWRDTLPQNFLQLRFKGGTPIELPYEKLDWIRSDGNQYIDTGIISSYIGGKVEIKTTNTTNIMNTTGVYGFVNRTNLDEKMGIGISEEKNVFVNSKNTTSLGNVGINELIEISWDKNLKTINFNGKIISFNNPEETLTSFTNYLFTRNNGNDEPDLGYFWQGKVYYLREYDESNNLLINLIPAKLKSTGEIGMWDLISDKFFANKGTGEFLITEIATWGDLKITTWGNLKTKNITWKMLKEGVEL